MIIQDFTLLMRMWYKISRNSMKTVKFRGFLKKCTKLALIQFLLILLTILQQSLCSQVHTDKVTDMSKKESVRITSNSTLHMDSFKCFRKSLTVPFISSSILTFHTMFTKAIDTKNQIYLPDYKMGQNSNLNSSCKVSFMLQKTFGIWKQYFFLYYSVSYIIGKLSSVQTVKR